MIHLHLRYFIYLIIASFLFSCNHRHQETLEAEEEIYTPIYSSNFSIKGFKNSPNILIEVYNPWQGADNVTSKLLIVRDSIVPLDFNGQILQGEAQRIVCMSSTHIAMLDALDKIDGVVGVSGKQYISNPKIIASSSFIPDVGYEGNMDYEALLSTNPDLVLLFSINGTSTLEPRLKEFGIPFLYVGDYVEEDPLGKAEWIIPIAETMGLRNKSEETFSEIAARYEKMKGLVKESNLRKPKVMVNLPFLDAWYMPSSNSYVARMIEDAGGEYIYKKNTGSSSMPIDIEEALDLVSRADLWINTGTLNSLDELKNSYPKFNNTLCVKEGNIYNNNRIASPGGGNDCYESGVLHPDIILQDLITIFHPEISSAPLTYYHQLK